MDKLKSQELEVQLKGMALNGFKVLELINNGKSAAVFRAEKDGKFYAIKIFDNELIERFGHEIQSKRIVQEIALKNHTISNLVKIYEGGDTVIGNQKFYYIVMELIIGSNLKDYINSNSYNQAFIIKVLEKLIDTTKQLLIEVQIAHRDIKPENIMVNENGDIILMDLGVLKLIGAPSFSDAEEKSFVGTLRYAAPEFLLRNEEDTSQGWHAINIYQIGATLHDLIMKKELFHDKIPYSNLVIAIKEDTPKISNDAYSFELQQLARDMMTKDWKKRLSLITDSRIEKALLLKETFDSPFDESIEKIKKMRLDNQPKIDELDNLKRTKESLRKNQKEVGVKLTKVIDDCFEIVKENEVCKSIKKSGNFILEKDYYDVINLNQNYLYELTGDLKMGFPSNLYILIKIKNDESNYTIIEMLGIFPHIFVKSKIEDPINFLKEIVKEKDPYNRNNFKLNTIEIFKGVVDFDNSFNNFIKNKIIAIITKALQLADTNVKEALKQEESRINSKQSVFITTSSGKRSIIIDSLLEN